VNTNHVLLSGTAEANSTIKVFDGTAQVGTTTAGTSGAWSVTTGALTNGTHSLTATATDVAGTTSAASQPLDPVIGASAPSSAPSAPTITSFSPDTGVVGDGITDANTLTLTGTAAANSTVKVFDGTTQIGTATATSNGAWTFNTAALADGKHGFTATDTVSGATSAASSALSATVDTIAPAAPVIVSDSIVHNNRELLSGTAEAGSTVKVYEGPTLLGTTTAGADGNWSVTTSALKHGSHTFVATATDAAGNTSALSQPLDPATGSHGTHAPAAPTMAVYSPDGKAVGGTTAVHDFLLKGTADANSTIDVFDSGKQIGTTTTNGSGAWSLDTGHLANGSHSFTATAMDVAGNTSAASPAKAETVTAPAAPIEFTHLHENSNHTATIKGTADAYSQIKLYDGTVSLGSVTAAANGTWSFTTPQLSNTVHTFKAQEVDSTGHVIATSSGEAILGSTHSSTLTSTAGNNVFVGNAHHDTFVFAANFGNDVIQDFVAGGRGHDTIQFSKTVFDSFASVLSHASQAGQDVVISTGSDTLTLKNTKLGALNSHDFHFA
jgi:hypothetical protein